MARRGRGRQGQAGLTTANLLAGYGVEFCWSSGTRRPSRNRAQFRSMTNRCGQCRPSALSTQCCRALCSDTDPTTSACEDRAFFEFAPHQRNMAIRSETHFASRSSSSNCGIISVLMRSTKLLRGLVQHGIDRLPAGPDVVHLVLRRRRWKLDRDLRFLSDACDGGRSFVREKLGIKLSGSTLPRTLAHP